MIGVLAVWSVVLTIAVLLLFAMMGELASRTGLGRETDEGQAEPFFENYAAPVGRHIHEWPTGWDVLPKGSGHILAFSSVCSSCPAHDGGS